MNREKLKKNFEEHGFNVKFFNTGNEAADYILETIKGTSVSTGGSMSMKSLGLLDSLSAQNDFYKHTPKDDIERFREELTSEVFICSANGVSETGEIVNIDAIGNRVAGTVFGHNKVYMLIGKNKIEATLTDAINRAKQVSAPLNSARLKKKTPCSITGKCANCNCPDRICNVTVILDRAPWDSYYELLFVDENLGL